MKRCNEKTRNTDDEEDMKTSGGLWTNLYSLRHTLLYPSLVTHSIKNMKETKRYQSCLYKYKISFCSKVMDGTLIHEFLSLCIYKASIFSRVVWLWFLAMMLALLTWGAHSLQCTAICHNRVTRQEEVVHYPRGTVSGWGSVAHTTD